LGLNKFQKNFSSVPSACLGRKFDPKLRLLNKGSAALGPMFSQVGAWESQEKFPAGASVLID
jgi:hypothetical protein